MSKITPRELWLSRVKLLPGFSYIEYHRGLLTAFTHQGRPIESFNPRSEFAKCGNDIPSGKIVYPFITIIEEPDKYPVYIQSYENSRS